MNDTDPFGVPEDLSEADRFLAQTVRDWAEKEVIAGRTELKEDYEAFLRPALRTLMVDIGLQRMFWPESLGGDGYSESRAALTVTAALEQAGRADTGIAFLAAHSLALQAALNLCGEGGTPSVRELAPVFCEAAEPVLVSFVLPAYANEALAPDWRGYRCQVRASDGDGRWVLTGRRARPTCSGADADLFGIWCGCEVGGETAFVLVPGDSPGVGRGPRLKESGLAASRNAEVDFDRVEVSREGCAWRVDDGLRRLLCWFNLCACAACVGSLLAAYEIMREWGDNRVIKGRGNIFKENPLAASVMGEIAGDIWVARRLAYDLASMLAGSEARAAPGEEMFVSSSVVTHHVFRSSERAVNRILELMNSAGYAREWQIERYWRDLRTMRCNLGPTELANMDVTGFFCGSRTLWGDRRA